MIPEIRLPADTLIKALNIRDVLIPDGPVGDREERFNSHIELDKTKLPPTLSHPTVVSFQFCPEIGEERRSGHIYVTALYIEDGGALETHKWRFVVLSPSDCIKNAWRYAVQSHEATSLLCGKPQRGGGLDYWLLQERYWTAPENVERPCDVVHFKLERDRDRHPSSEGR